MGELIGAAQRFAGEALRALSLRAALGGLQHAGCTCSCPACPLCPPASCPGVARELHYCLELPALPAWVGYCVVVVVFLLGFCLGGCCGIGCTCLYPIKGQSPVSHAARRLGSLRADVDT